MNYLELSYHYLTVTWYNTRYVDDFHADRFLHHDFTRIWSGSFEATETINELPSLIGPLEKDSKRIIRMFTEFLYKMPDSKTLFFCFPEVLEALGSSGRLVGTISTYPGTYKSPW